LDKRVRTHGSESLGLINNRSNEFRLMYFNQYCRRRQKTNRMENELVFKIVLLSFFTHPSYNFDTETVQIDVFLESIGER